MAIHAEAVDILVRKSHFEPEVALGVAEAIEVSINLTQVVTVPLLDERLQDLRHDVKSEFAQLRTELATLRADMLSEFGRMRTEMATEFASMRTEMTTELAKVRIETAAEFGRVRSETADAVAKVRSAVAVEFGNMRGQTAEVKADLMRWVLLCMLGSAVISMAANPLVKALYN